MSPKILFISKYKMYIKMDHLKHKE